MDIFIIQAEASKREKQAGQKGWGIVLLFIYISGVEKHTLLDLRKSNKKEKFNMI